MAQLDGHLQVSVEHSKNWRFCGIPTVAVRLFYFVHWERRTSNGREANGSSTAENEA
jgi:hypothetical protein